MKNEMRIEVFFWLIDWSVFFSCPEDCCHDSLMIASSFFTTVFVVLSWKCWHDNDMHSVSLWYLKRLMCEKIMVQN